MAKVAAIMDGKMKNTRPKVTQRDRPSRVILPPGVKE